MQRLLVVALVASLAACASTGPRTVELSVHDAGRSAQCNTPGSAPRAEILDGAAAVRAWQTARGVELIAADALKDVPHALIEIGRRPTGGYSVALGPSASVRGDGRITLTATQRSPGVGSMVTQSLTSPCALAALPPGRYSGVDVLNAQGATWISTPATSTPGSGTPAR